MWCGPRRIGGIRRVVLVELRGLVERSGEFVDERRRGPDDRRERRRDERGEQRWWW